MHDAADLMWQVLLPPAGHRSGDAERRAFPRWQAAFPVLHGNGDEFRMGAAVDLSEDGLRFVGFCDYGKDAVIHLHMQVGPAPSDWMRVRGIVQRCEGSHTAVQFLDLSRADRLRLLEWYRLQQQATNATHN